jgi:hypothetical protein
MPQRLLLEGPDIDELLLRVQAEHGPDARIVHAEQKLVGGIAGFFARRRYELSVQIDDDVVAEPASPASPRSFEDLIADADGADASDAASGRTPLRAVDAHVPVQRGRRLSTETPQFENLLTSLLDRVEREDEGTTSTSAAATELERLGAPVDLLGTITAADPRTALLDLLGRLPQPTSGRLWGTTVVVGPADLARRAVEAIEAHTGGTGTAPLVASSLAPSAADLAVRASALCTTDGAAMVVIETPATRSAARRAGRLLAGLGLGTVVAAVDATRDVGATREWLAELGAAGRHVDQLAVFDVAESPSPLALLGLGPDVAWLDGRAATVGTWAAPCLDRLLANGA